MVAMKPRTLLVIVIASCGISAQTPQRVPTKEVQQLMAKANGGDAEAQFNLALKYGTGAGVPKSYPEEAAWMRKAADQGMVRAQYEAGHAVCQRPRGDKRRCRKRPSGWARPRKAGTLRPKPISG